MKINTINNTSFCGHIKHTNTYRNLLTTASKEVRMKALDIEEAISKKKDSLVYSFANSKAKRNGQDVFHIALLEEDTRESGYKVPRVIKEIPEKYRDIEQACNDNKNLLASFYDFFSLKYCKEFEDLKSKWENFANLYKEQ